MSIAIVYMVAGMSSRFGGRIKQFAKVGLNNETLIEHSLNQAIKAGFDKIIFIVGDKTEQGFKDMFGDFYKSIPVYYAFQKFDEVIRDKPWGTTDALCCAENLLDCPFVVCNGDDIYGEESFRKLIEHSNENKTCATIGYKLGEVLSENGSVNRGVFQFDDNKNLVSISEIFGITRENLEENNLKDNALCSMNIFLLTPQIVSELRKKLLAFKERNKSDRKIECLLPAELTNLINEQNLNIKVIETNDKCIGITHPEDEEIVRRELYSKFYK
jgi:dTDP-glucose pyrophosphorylase